MQKNSSSSTRGVGVHKLQPVKKQWSNWFGAELSRGGAEWMKQCNRRCNRQLRQQRPEGEKHIQVQTKGVARTAGLCSNDDGVCIARVSYGPPIP